VSLVHAVEVPRLPVSRLEPVIGASRYAELTGAVDLFRPVLGGRTVWNVNSTAAGGGVAEMLQVLVGYVQDLDIPIGWLVITGDAGFFAITKRLHNQIHGTLSGSPLGAAEAGHYTQMLAANAVELAARVRPGDVVLLHDPQTAGLAAPLARAGARVVWRCHIGVGWEDEVTRAGWEFLRPHLAAAEAYVFSRRDYVPAWVPAGKAWIIPPSIDPFSPKNQQLQGETVRAILVMLGVLDGAAVYGECLLQWHDLSPAARTRILLVTLPLDDIDENAAMVNALQRHATVIAQKSLAEGFGLTVAEGMWKGRPVIGSAVGGIIDQIAEGTGILLPDPADLTAFGSAACRLLGDQDQAARMGQAAHARVREQYVGDATCCATPGCSAR
jgi:trehalose synthase